MRSKVFTLFLLAISFTSVYSQSVFDLIIQGQSEIAIKRIEEQKIDISKPTGTRGLPLIFELCNRVINEDEYRMVYEIDEDISRSISSSIIYLLKSGAKREYYYLFDKAIYQKGSTASGIDPIYYTALSLAHYYDDYLLLDYLIETKSIDLTRQIWMDDALKPINSLQLMFDENVMQRYYTRTFSRNPMIYEKLLSYATAIGIDVTKTKLKLGIKYYIYKDDISMFKEAIVGFDDLDAFARDFAEYFESSKILDFLTNLGY